MALENANYIPELVETNPDGADPANTLDDHDRTIKRSVKNSFPGFVGTTASPKSVTLTEDQINDAAQKGASNVFTQANTFNVSGNPALSIDNPQSDNPGVEVYSRTGNKRKVGFRNTPLEILPDVDYTFTQDDEATIMRRDHSGRVFTVPQLETDTELAVLTSNVTGTTFVEGTGVTLRWAAGTGSQILGPRSLAGGSFVWLKWQSATQVLIVGNGIS